MSDRITANLPSRDFDGTIAFYGRLGFDLAYRDQHWLILERGPLELEFFPYPDLDPASSFFSACIRVDDLAGLYTDFAAADLPGYGIPRLEPIRPIVDDLFMFGLIDPDGSLLRGLGEGAA
jgi:catechol 2,3-dioxygenase-like lactoylglutathione lyase family enzyme